MNWDEIKVVEEYYIRDGLDMYVVQILENTSDHEYWNFKVKPLYGTIKPPFNIHDISRLRTMSEGLFGVPAISKISEDRPKVYSYGGSLDAIKS